jgi:hypothetical protein
MMRKGLAGIVSFSFGGMLLFLLLDTITHFDSAGLNFGGLPVLSLVGFLLVGLGLWLIVQDGKMETKQNP